MKQPILFQTRAVDFEEIVKDLDVELCEKLEVEHVTTPTHFLYRYLKAADYDQLSDFYWILFIKHDINLRSMRYTNLDVPVAVDLETGEAYPIVCVEYSHINRKIMYVLVHKDGELQYIYNKELNYYSENSYGTTLKILNDGWV